MMKSMASMVKLAMQSSIDVAKLAIPSGSFGMPTNLSPAFNITINHSGEMTDADAKRYGRAIGDEALSVLWNGFQKRGIS